jgi:alpha-amylase
VLNHKGGADNKESFAVKEVSQTNRNQPISQQYIIDGYTSFNFPSRGSVYSQFKWKFDHFTGVDFDVKTGKKSIYQIQPWATQVDLENGNYDYLLLAEIAHSHPEVKQDLENWGQWVIQEVS